MGTLVGYLAGSLAGKYLMTELGWRRITDVTEGHRVLFLVLEDYPQVLRKSLWDEVEIADPDGNLLDSLKVSADG